MQASMRASIHPGAHTLGLLFYSDAAEARRFQHKFHPLSLYIANFTLNGIRSQRGFRRVAHLPVLQKEDFPKLTPKQLTALQRRVRHATLSEAMAPFKELSYTGFDMLCNDNKIRYFVPTLVAYVADIKEANEVYNIAPYPAFRPDIGTLVHRSDMNMPDLVAEPRTEENMSEMLSDLHQLLEEECEGEAQAFMKEHSLSLPVMTALAGFNFVTNAYATYYPDRLHQSSRGLAETIMGFLQKRLAIRELASLNSYIGLLPGFPAFNVPSAGMDVDKKATASEMADLFKLMPVALLSVPRQFEVFGEVMQELLEFHTLRDLEQHTDQSLEAMEKSRKRVQRLCSSKLVRVDDHGNTVSMSPTDFSTPKQFLMGQWGRTIMSLGSANLTSTGYGERSHVALKESYRFTNRRDQDAINKQSIQHTARREVAASLVVASKANPFKPVMQSQSAAQKAAASNKAVLTTSKQPMNYLGSRDTTSIKRCLGGDDSMVQLFHRALGIALGAAVNCDFADLPQTWNGQVNVSGGMGIAHQLHRGSNLRGITLRAGGIMGSLRHDCVRVSAEGGKTWFAQLLLLFSYQDTQNQMIDAAFVRWFTVCQRAAHAKSIKLQPLKWEMQKVRGRPAGPRTDIIQLDAIVGPCYVQQDPRQPNMYYYNHWVGNTTN
ncbi:hypothetical protein WJX79_005315 [Trebouxia sp. C0005]